MDWGIEFRPDIVFWACLALGLFALEALIPGAALLWLGLAAGALLLVVSVFSGIPIFWQAVLFVVLSFASISIYWRYYRRHETASDQPLLNQRGAQLIGQIHLLDQAIVNGRGRIKIGDAYWTAQGSDAPVGMRVRIIEVDSMTLKVEPVENTVN